MGGKMIEATIACTGIGTVRELPLWLKGLADTVADHVAFPPFHDTSNIFLCLLYQIFRG